MSSRLGLGPMNDTSDIDGFANRVDRRIRHLANNFFEVVGERLVAVVAANGLSLPSIKMASSPGLRHGRQQELDVFLRGAEGPAGGSSRLTVLWTLAGSPPSSWGRRAGMRRFARPFL